MAGAGGGILWSVRGGGGSLGVSRVLKVRKSPWRGCGLGCGGGAGGWRVREGGSEAALGAVIGGGAEVVGASGAEAAGAAAGTAELEVAEAGVAGGAGGGDGEEGQGLGGAGGGCGGGGGG